MYAQDQPGMSSLPSSGAASQNPLQQILQLLRMRQTVQGFQNQRQQGQGQPLPPVGTQLTTPQGDPYTEDDASGTHFPPSIPPGLGQPAHAPLMNASHRMTLENLAKAKAVAATMGHLRQIRPYAGPKGF